MTRGALGDLVAGVQGGELDRDAGVVADVVWTVAAAAMAVIALE